MTETVLPPVTDEDEYLPPLVSPAVLASQSEERHRTAEERPRDRFEVKLREKWSCNRAGHDVCWRGADNGHVPLTSKQIERWFNKWVSNTYNISHNPLIGVFF